MRKLYDILIVVFQIGQSKQEVSVDALMQRMRFLSQKRNEIDETELNDRFKTVEMQVKSMNKKRKNTDRNQFVTNTKNSF